MSLHICPVCHQHSIQKICPHCSATPSNRKSIPLAVLLGVSLVACEEPTALYGAPAVDDYDQDGFTWEEGDCDDYDAMAFPGAAELDSETECMRDNDGDGFGDADPANSGVIAGTDCDDTDPDTNPANDNCP